MARQINSDLSYDAVIGFIFVFRDICASWSETEEVLKEREDASFQRLTRHTK